jgi:hypothetical protein
MLLNPTPEHAPPLREQSGNRSLTKGADVALGDTYSNINSNLPVASIVSAWHQIRNEAAASTENAQ